MNDIYKIILCPQINKYSIPFLSLNISYLMASLICVWFILLTLTLPLPLPLPILLTLPILSLLPLLEIGFCASCFRISWGVGVSWGRIYVLVLLLILLILPNLQMDGYASFLRTSWDV